ncbi:MAG: hypothetical protein ACYDCN_08055 [Bacteroidia bacterium]
MDPKDKADLDNHANQLNDNNDAYWQSRGYDEKPDDDDHNHSTESDDDAFDSYMSDDY